jgi:hypothetical protein
MQTDPDSQAFLARMAEAERVLSNRVPGVRTVLVVLSAAGIVYDIESLRQKVHLSYPDAAVFFQTPGGKGVGAIAPKQVDLLVDFTGPGQREPFFFARRLRKNARVAVGRTSGFLRKRIYDKVYDEKAHSAELPREMLARERVVQKEVLHLAGVAFSPSGDTGLDRGKTIALELPPMRTGR